MRQSSFVFFLLINIAMVPGLNGCATIRTVPNLASYGSPKVYSGTRLDYNAATENRAGLAKFKAEPPRYPLIDIPFSAILDTVLLLVTIPVATYELVFEQ
ncbi:MAG: hypothetical protein A2Z46_01300 [Nitrospirae bacterium RBG_19FT_COMBO_55_12]|nr:MAG: hypothetical protein A2Z46_01300 [Nitrospirae bacterium RBG_19FT_COMBO_55_12]